MHKLKLSGAVLLVAGMSTGMALAAASPTVTTGPATSIHQTYAVLNGSVNPNGSTTTYHFEWGPTPALGSASATVKAGSGSKPVAVQTTAGSLTPGTVYYYRLDAANASGSTLGATRTFKTAGPPPPGATTGGATNVTRNSATLTGVVYPNDEATTWYFQWGINGYEYQTFGGTVPAGTAAQEVSDGLYGLQSGLIFHYRLVVQHGSTAVTPGSDAFFETYPSPRPRPRIFAASTPRRARTPATYTTSGRLRGPAYTPSSLQCTGNVRVTYSLGRRVERRLLAPVQPSCTFAATATFKRLPGRGPKHRSVRLTVRIRFLGNHYLAPASARRETVTLR